MTVQTGTVPLANGASPSFGEAVTFLIIIAVLVVRPEGVFGRVKVRKA